MSFQHKKLTCLDCSKTFTFSTEEQEQFRARGYSNEPKRCPECRQARKSARNISGNGSLRYTPGRQMYSTVCADCGKATSVPFEPRQGRPVYCGDCYRKVKVSRY